MDFLLETTVLLYITLSTLNCLNAGQLNMTLVFSSDTLVNIVTNRRVRSQNDILYIPETHSQFQNNPLNTHATWTTENLNLRIPEFALQDNLTLSRYYFQFQSRLGSERIVFVLNTNGSFWETAKAIDNSGYGTSSRVTFFVLVKSLLDEVVIKFINSPDKLLAYQPIRPFHAHIIFFSPAWDTQIAYCYYCTGTWTKLFPIPSLLSEDSFELAKNLNSNGHKNEVSIGSRYYIYILLEFPDQKSCWNLYPNHKAGRDKLLDIVMNYHIADEIYISPLQHVLNLSFVTNALDNGLSTGTEVGAMYDGWFLQIRTGESLFSKFPNQFAISRGAAYPSLFFDYLLDKFGFCNYYYDPESRDLNFSFVSIVDIYVWGLFFVVVLCYSFIWKSAKQVMLLFAMVGGSISIPVRLRKYIYVYLCCATFFSWVYNSQVSSDTLRLDDVNNPVWYINAGYKIYIKQTVMTGITFSYAFLQFLPWGRVVLKFEEYFSKNVFEAIETHEFIHLQFLEIVEYMSNKKVAIVIQGLRYYNLINFFKKNGRQLVDQKYSCQALDFPNQIKTRMRPSLRAWGPLSDRLQRIFSRWIEIGWLDKVWQMQEHAGNLKLGLKNVDIVLLDRFPPTRPLSLWSFIGVVAALHCSLGVASLLILSTPKLYENIKAYFRVVLVILQRHFKQFRKCVYRRIHKYSTN